LAGGERGSGNLAGLNDTRICRRSAVIGDLPSQYR
jgi:hypothetical protein